MKKIFAIALALVMVLSMASAFAMNCLTVDWSTTTNCGTGTVEVVPYVKGNAANGANKWVASDCAAAVNNDFVFFAVKVTVADTPNAEWWDKASLKVTVSDGLTAGLTAGRALKSDAVSLSGLDFGGPVTDLDVKVVAAEGSLKAGTYYLKSDAAGFTTTFSADNLFATKVGDVAQGVEVCAKIESSAKADDAAIEINGATVRVWAAGSAGEYSIQVDDVAFNFDKTGKFLSATVNGTTYHTFCDGKYMANDGVYAEASCAKKDDYKAINDAMAAINIVWGQKITRATAVAKLQWSAKVSDCAKWNDTAYSVVDPNCVVSIPKTGDVSVVAYAVMAVVAAAGAMLKK